MSDWYGTLKGLLIGVIKNWGRWMWRQGGGCLRHSTRRGVQYIPVHVNSNSYIRLRAWDCDSLVASVPKNWFINCNILWIMSEMWVHFTHTVAFHLKIKTASLKAYPRYSVYWQSNSFCGCVKSKLPEHKEKFVPLDRRLTCFTEIELVQANPKFSIIPVSSE